MTDRELLKEARDALEWFLGPFVGAGTGPKDLRALQNRIDKHLADHSPDAGNTTALELVEKIKTLWTDNYDGERHDIFCPDCWKKYKAEAAALIESYGRRVPKELLSELFWAGMRFQKFHDGPYQVKELIEIAAKYGVKIEEAGE